MIRIPISDTASNIHPVQQPVHLVILDGADVVKDKAAGERVDVAEKAGGQQNEERCGDDAPPTAHPLHQGRKQQRVLTLLCHVCFN